jgi:NitT/TauT family transport system ATP-binding protein
MDKQISDWEIVCKAVSHEYRTEFSSIAVLDDISLTIGGGDITVVLGPSGCGKSTLMRILAGYESPCAGQVAFLSEDAEGGNRPSTSFMAQDDQLLSFRTSLQNVLLPAEIAGQLTPTMQEQAIKLLTRAGLGDFLHSLPNELSGGMRQRCLMGMHLMRQRQLFIFDEPFAALDVQTVDIMSSILHERKTKNAMAFLLVLHDVAAAAALGDTIYVLSSRPAKVLSVHRPNSNLSALPPQRRKKDPGFDTLVLDILHSIEASDVERLPLSNPTRQ